VTAVIRGPDGVFEVTVDGERLSASHVVLATGVVDVQPPLSNAPDADGPSRLPGPGGGWSSSRKRAEMHRNHRLRLPLNRLGVPPSTQQLQGNRRPQSRQPLHSRSHTRSRIQGGSPTVPGVPHRTRARPGTQETADFCIGVPSVSQPTSTPRGRSCS
jgi:hypothetical protein